MDNNQQKSCEKVKRSKKCNGSINEEKQYSSQGEGPFEKQQHQQQDINGISEILHLTIDFY